MAPCVGKENAPPCQQQVATNANDNEAPLKKNWSVAVIEAKQDVIQRFQAWWAAGKGTTAAAAHPLLRVVDAAMLAEIVAAGAAYHNCIGIERLDSLLNTLDKAAHDASLDSLRKAMQTKGGAKNQARAVGSLLFSAAESIFHAEGGGESGKVQEPQPRAEEVKEVKEVQEAEVEALEPAVLFQCTGPEDASIAVRREPRQESELLTTVTRGAEVLAVARQGAYLQIKRDGQPHGWVLRVLGDLVLFVEKAGDAREEPKAAAPSQAAEEMAPAAPPASAAAAPAPAAATEAAPPVAAELVQHEVETAAASTEAVLEQEGQIQRFQCWWAEGHGTAAARSDPMLSLLDPNLLHEVIAAGANYHTCLSAGRLDTLQRSVDHSSSPGAQPLRRALQSKGGAKAQARAVGSVLFKAAMDVFLHPRDVPDPQPHEEPKAQADETFRPKRRFACSESFPSNATVAVRSAPSLQSQFLASLPHGTELWATARYGDFLQFDLQEPACVAYVPLVFQGMQLFVSEAEAPVERSEPELREVSRVQRGPSAPDGSGAPGACACASGERLAQMEGRMERQEAVIKALQAELASLRAHMAAVATAFGALAKP
ncbi:unnamed protein product [Effrenium voratum]|nr:unnamed protein product [Effrenium voratum]